MTHTYSSARLITQEPDVHTLSSRTLECITAGHTPELVDLLPSNQAIYDCTFCKREYVGNHPSITDL